MMIALTKRYTMVEYLRYIIEFAVSGTLIIICNSIKKRIMFKIVFKVDDGPPGTKRFV